VIRLLRNRNIANTFWNISDIFLYPLLFFGSTSFFIQKLGAAQFGIWMLINTIVITMQVFNFGIGSSIFKSVAMHAGNNDEQNRLKAVNSSLSITFLLFILCIIAAGLMAYLVYYFGLFRVEPAFKALCSQGVLLAGFIVGFKFLEQVFSNYFKGLEQFRTAAALSSGNKMIALLLNIGIMFFFPANVLHLLLCIIAVNFLFLLLSLYNLRKTFDVYAFRFDPRLPRHDARFAAVTWLQSLAIIFTFQADRYLIVNYFGLSVLSYYALTATIFTHLHMGFSAVFPWLAPKLTRLYVRNADTGTLYTAARNLMAAGAVVLLLALYFAYPFVFTAILGRQTAAAVQQYVQHFIVFELFFVLTIIPTYYFNAMGQEKVYLYFLFFFALSTLSAMFISLYLVHKPIAVLYGLIVSCLIGVIVQYVLVGRSMHNRMDIAGAFVQLIPSVLAAVVMLSTDTIVRTLMLVALCPAIYFINIKGNRHKFRILLSS
jgi:O-antigen/teichoic acid export membrane protein